MCCRIASSKVKEITDRLKKSLEDDKRERCILFSTVCHVFASLDNIIFLGFFGLVSFASMLPL